MKKLSRLAAALMVFVLALSLATVQKVAANEYLRPENLNDLNLEIPAGETTHISVPIRTTGSSLTLYSINVVPDDSARFTISNIKLVNHVTGNELSGATINIHYNSNISIEFDVTASDNAEIGYHNIYVKGTGTIYMDGYSVINNETLLTFNTYTPNQLDPIQLYLNEIIYNEFDVYPDNYFEFVFDIANNGAVKAVNSYLTVDFGASGIIPDYQLENIKIGSIDGKKSKSVTVPVRVLPNAEVGLQKLTATITCQDETGAEKGPFTYSVYVNIMNWSGASLIELTTEDNYKQLTPGTLDNLSLTVANTGETDAYDVIITPTGLDAASGLTKNFTSDGIQLNKIAAGETKQIEIPINVSESFAPGLYEIGFKATYTDNWGNARTPANMTMYVSGAVTTDKLMISNVSQSPAIPQAGEQITVSFDLTNPGNASVSDVKLYGKELSSMSFEPISSNPYVRVGELAAGETKKVSMTFKVGEKIAEGLHTLSVGYDFMTVSNKEASGSEQFYILNVENNLESQKNIGKPKLIISTFGTDEEILKAGSTFNFNFCLKNTHTNKSAKNIKITLTQDEGIFAPTEGTNIFYIEEIGAGAEAQETINLKTRSDAATGDYSISLLVEYEYDEMSETDLEKGGVSEENIVKLRATENYRPVIENIRIDAWDTVYVGDTVDLSFEFYNMGKSTLGNVYITVEGDFCLANNSEMSYIGAVSGYGQEYINPQVVPLIAGEAFGTLTVHFEDSNGDEVTLSSDFSYYVEEPGGMDMGFEDPGMWGDMGIPVFDEEPVEEDIMQLWLFLVIIGGIIVIVTPVTYKIAIGIKKKKLRKIYDKEDEEE